MEGIVWAMILLYTLGAGYFAAVRLGNFISSNTGAFPGNRRIVVASPPSWQHDLEGDGTCNP